MEKEIIYAFYELSWIEGVNILVDLGLASQKDASNPTLLKTAMRTAKKQGKLEELYKKICGER